MAAQLRGKPVSERQKSTKRLKLFVYGAAGTGKSYFCTQFNKPYYVDTEKGVGNSKYEENIARNQGVIFETRSFKELFEEIKTLASVQHDYQTLVIDPITPIYNNLLDDFLNAAKMRSTKSRIGEHYQETNKQFQRLIDLLLTIDMNVIVTAHSKDKYGTEMSVIGTTFDAYKKFDYLFDVVLETQLKNNQYMAVALKSRLTALAPNQVIPFSFEQFKELYSKELVDKAPTPLLAQPAHEISQENLASLVRRYLNELSVPLGEVDNWLKKAQVNTIEELSMEQLTAVYRMLKARKERKSA